MPALWSWCSGKYQFIYPPGDLINGNTELLNTAGQEVANSVDLDAGLYACTLEIITPVPYPGPPASFTVDPRLSPDGTPPEASPGINFDGINVGDCTGADERTVTVNALVTPTAGTVVDAELILVRASTLNEADTALGSGDVLDSAMRQDPLWRGSWRAKDDAKALKWIGKSNEQGNVGGQSMLADTYGRAEEFDRVREVALPSH